MNTVLWDMLFLCTSVLFAEVLFYDNLFMSKTKMPIDIPAAGLLDSTIDIKVR